MIYRGNIQMIMTCNKCNTDKNEQDFYTSSHTECKECVKKRVRLRESILREDSDWCDKEKQRAKDKYYRLGYRERQYELNKKRKYKNSAYKNLHRDCIVAGIITKEQRIHHWNYSLLYSFFILSEKDHRKIHTKLVLSDNQDVFITKDGIVLDTIDRHKQVIESVTSDYVYYEYVPSNNKA